MRVQVAIPDAHITSGVLDAALEPVTKLNEQLLAAGQVPTFEDALPTGIKWKPEPPGGERFDHAGTVMARKWGDCDDLAPWHAASLRHTGEDPDAKAIVRRSGPSTWHAIVQRGDGSIEDPSKAAGMPSGGARVSGCATCPPMVRPRPSVSGVSDTQVARPAVAIRKIYDQGYQARVDIPWFGRDPSGKPSKQDIAMAVLKAAPTAGPALTGAIDGAVRLAIVGQYAAKEHIDRLCCIADAVSGKTFHELARVYGPDHAHAAVNFVAGTQRVYGLSARQLVGGAAVPLAPATGASRLCIPVEFG